MRIDKADYKKYIWARRITNSDKASKKELKTAFGIWLDLEAKEIWSGFYLGVCYDFGLGTKKNRRKAFKLYKRAAEDGISIAMYNTFLMYRDGIGVRKNNKAALKWLKYAVKTGDADAIGDLGYCYHEGKLVSKNLPKAALLYRKAAKREDLKSQWNLALCYLDGDGLKPSKRWAMYWLAKAATRGHKNSIRKLKELR